MNNSLWIAWNYTDELVRLGYIGTRTARRWRQTHRIPTWAAAWIQLIADGDLGRLSPQWAGWRLFKDELCSPENWTFKPAEVESIPLRHQQIAALNTELRQLNADRQALRELILARG